MTGVPDDLDFVDPARAAALHAVLPDAVSRYLSASVLHAFGIRQGAYRPPQGGGLTELPCFSLFEEFFAPQEIVELTDYVLAREQDFRTSQVISPVRNEGRMDLNHRRSRVLFDLGIFEEVISDRLTFYFPQILDSIGYRDFDISRIEAQITASSDGEFFRLHNDNSHPCLTRRELTYVLFFHREPARFTGGELRIYDTRIENGRCVAGDIYASIVPRQNMVVFFPSYLMHQVETVHCSSRAFADSRFTLNGWIHRNG
jgi:SM-20-related protein